MTEAEKIAAGLTERGKEALDWVRPHSIIAPYRTGFREILDAGLVRMDGVFATITETGLAVRAHLQKDQSNGKG